MLALASVLAVSSLVWRSPLTPALMGSAVVLTLFLASSYAFFHAQLLAAERLRVSRAVQTPVIEGREVEVAIRVENPTPIPLELVELRAPYPKFFKLVRGRALTVTTIPPKSAVELRYAVKPRVGRHTFEPVDAVVRDVFGLFRRRLTIGDKLEVRVAPRLQPITAFISTSTARPGGLSRSKKRGFGVEFYGVREYVPGDEYRWIEWKASARHGLARLFVKEFEHEASLNIFIIIDSAAPMFSGAWGSTPIEYCARTALSIAEYASRKGDSVAVIVAGPGGIISTIPKRGRSAIREVRRALSSISWPDGGGLPASLGYGHVITALKTHLPRMIPRERNVVMLFTGLYTASGIGELVSTLHDYRAKGNVVLVMVPMIEFFEAASLKGIRAAVYRLRAIRVLEEKYRALDELLKRGIAAITVGPHDITDAAILRLESVREALG